MKWRSWSATNPCPVCSGHRWSGASAAQCRGGYQPARSLQRVWCSVQDSGEPSASGVTWEWRLTAPYLWQPEPKRRSGAAGFAEHASRMPADLWKEGGWERTAIWIYRDADCSYRFSVARFDRAEDGRKTYRPGRQSREGSPWIQWGLPTEARIPYQLPRLRKAIGLGLPLYIVEGEKSADAINELDIGLRHFTATTMPCGAVQWSTGADPHPHFAGAQAVTVIVDRDTAGEGWARDVHASLLQLTPTPRVRFTRSRTTAPGDDAVDHLSAGYSLDNLEAFDVR